MRICILCPIALLFASAAWGSHIASTTLGAGGTGGVRTDSSTPLAPGQWSTGVAFETAFSDRLSQQELLELREQDPEASLHSIESIETVALELAYGLTDRITVGLHMPYVVRDDIQEAAHDEAGELATAGRPAAQAMQPLAAGLEGIEYLGQSAGFGDVSVYALWRFYENAASDTNIGFIGGVKMPTGATHELADTGERFETEFQPGSGSWDPFAGLAWASRTGPFNVAASARYLFATDGSQDTNLGDQLYYNAGAGYPLFNVEGTSWNVVLELNGGWRAKEKVSGETDGNSGGTWLLVSPGVIINGKSWSVYGSVGLPIDGSLNGNQDDLGTRVLVGLSFNY